MEPVTQSINDDVTVEFVADDLDPVIGLTLDGRFRVVGSVGKGAMGTVYKAIQEPLNRTVALKVLDSNYGAGRDETFRQRFLVEAALTAKLSHPNTVRIIDYGCTKDGLFYLAMEYLAGSTLDRVLQAQRTLSWRRVSSIGLQIARALREAHGLGVVHRDLKPANIMVLHADNDTDHVKVLDFGLVKSFVEGHELEGRAITQLGMLMGSPPYMAPEQGDQNHADPRSDIYSLGVVMFEALTGQPPFTGRAPLEIILKHVSQPVPPVVAPSGCEPVPEMMVALVNKCLAKSPMDRFQSMEELISALQVLTAAPIVTPPADTPVTAEVEGVLPRHRTGLMVVGLVAALILGAVGAAFVLHQPTQAPVVAPTLEEVRPKALAQAQFRVDSEPRGAAVLLDGKAMGLTPVDFELAEAGGLTQAQLTLTLEGYRPVTVTTARAGHIEVMQQLERAPASAPKPHVLRSKVVKAQRKREPVQPEPEPAAKLVDDEPLPLAPLLPVTPMTPMTHEPRDDEFKAPEPW